MSAFLLLPGSDGGATVWRHVAGLLSGGGHRVTAYAGWPEVGLRAQVADVATICHTEAVEVLVGWSYSGLVASLTAAAEPGLRQVVHVDSVLPGLTSDEREATQLLSPVVTRLIGSDIRLVLSAPPRGCPVEYIECLRRPAKPAYRAVELSAALARSSGWAVRGLDADHRAMVSQPAKLASLLDAVTR